MPELNPPLSAVHQGLAGRLNALAAQAVAAAARGQWERSAAIDALFQLQLERVALLERAALDRPLPRKG